MSSTPIVEIYNQLNGLFGSKVSLQSFLLSLVDSYVRPVPQAGQLFTMEYPGRILDIGNYAYKGSGGTDAQQVKPQTVVEAEFRLSDDLYNLGTPFILFPK